MSRAKYCSHFQFPSQDYVEPKKKGLLQAHTEVGINITTINHTSLKLFVLAFDPLTYAFSIFI